MLTMSVNLLTIGSNDVCCKISKRAWHLIRLFAVCPVHTRRNRNFNLNDNLLDGLSEVEVKSHYRFSRGSIQFITHMLASDLERPTKRNHAFTTP